MGKYTLSYGEPTEAPGVYLGVFPNGMPQEDALKEDGDDSVAFSVYANTSKRKAQQRLVVGENSAIEYVGQNFGADSLHSRFNKYLVGVIDEKAKTIRLHDAQAFSLKQRVKRVRYIDAADEELEDSRTDYQKQIAAKTSLVESFGARRNLQAIQSAQRNRVDTEAISGISAAISSRLEAHALDTPTVEDTQEQMDADRAIPPCNTDAADPADVYRFEDLISPDEYEALRQPAKLLVKATRTDIANWRAKKIYGEYILAHLEDMPSNSAQKNKVARALLYMSYLSKLYRSERQLNKEDHGLKDVPAVVRNQLLALFTVRAEGNDDKVEYRMPQKMKDKIVAYIIALALHIDGFSITFDVIGQDMKIDSSKMKNIIKGLGLRLDRTGKIAKLQIPLDFPKINIRKIKT